MWHLLLEIILKTSETSRTTAQYIPGYFTVNTLQKLLTYLLTTGNITHHCSVHIKHHAGFLEDIPYSSYEPGELSQ